MDQKLLDECLATWRRLVDAEDSYYYERMQLFAQCRDSLVEIVRLGIKNLKDRRTALNVATLLSVEEKKDLFAELVFVASCENRFLVKARELILSLPKEWVIANIEQFAEPFLHRNDDNEYRRFLELYSELDKDLTIKLAYRAFAHENVDIKEAGQDFLEKYGINPNMI